MQIKIYKQVSSEILSSYLARLSNNYLPLVTMKRMNKALRIILEYNIMKIKTV